MRLSEEMLIYFYRFVSMDVGVSISCFSLRLEAQVVLPEPASNHMIG